MIGREPDGPTHVALVRVFLKISLLGFGGPNAHLALMLDEVVERREWLTREHFLHLIGATNLLPGPNSSEVAIHVGYTQRGWTGALATGLAFLLPTFLMVTALSALYFEYGALPSVEPVFWGMKPVIVAVIIAAGVKLGRTAVTGPLLWALAGAGAVVSGVAGGWAVAAMVAGGLVTWLEWWWRGGPTDSAGPADAPGPADSTGPAGPTGPAGSTVQDEEGGRGRGDRPGGGLAVLAPSGLAGLLTTGGTATVFLTHLWIGAILFGGGYVLVVLLEPQAVGRFGWLTSAQFLDGVALTQAVPGPISTLSAFVGYAAAGVPGAVGGTMGIYLPAFAAVLLVAPHLNRLRSLEPVRAVLGGVSAVVAGAIVGVAVTLLGPAVPDPWAAVLLVGAVVALWWKSVPAYAVVGAGLVAGLVRTGLLMLGS